MLKKQLKRLKAKHPELAYWYARQRAWINKRLVSDKKYVMLKHKAKFGVSARLGRSENVQRA